MDLNGIAYNALKFTVSDLKPQMYNVTLRTTQTSDFNAILFTKSVTVSKMTPKLDLIIDDVEIGEKIVLKATMSDNITSVVEVVVNGQGYHIDVVGGSVKKPLKIHCLQVNMWQQPNSMKMNIILV